MPKRPPEFIHREADETLLNWADFCGHDFLEELNKTKALHKSNFDYAAVCLRGHAAGKETESEGFVLIPPAWTAEDTAYFGATLIAKLALALSHIHGGTPERGYLCVRKLVEVAQQLFPTMVVPGSPEEKSRFARSCDLSLKEKAP